MSDPTFLPEWSEEQWLAGLGPRIARRDGVGWRSVSSREERVARNESISREINEEIEDAHGPDADGYVRMVCECGQPECDRLIAITISEYERIRTDPRTFAVMNEHVMADVETVLSENDRYTVVRKREGTPAAVAEALDPRP